EHMQALQRLEVLEHGHGVEQSLRWVGVHAVAGVDDGNVEMSCENVGCARRGMTDDDRIRAESADGQAGVDQRFALLDAGGGGAYQRGSRAEGFGGEFKGGS